MEVGQFLGVNAPCETRTMVPCKNTQGNNAVFAWFCREKPEPRTVEDAETANDVIHMFSQKTGLCCKGLLELSRTCLRS